MPTAPVAPAPSLNTARPGPIFGSGLTPTIDDLAKAQVAEQRAEAQRRLEKTFGGNASAPAASMAPVLAAPAQQQPSAAQASPVPPKAARIDMTKMVIAIYGPPGREVADIQLPGGAVQSVSAGSALAGFSVSRVTSSSVDLVRTRSSGAGRRSAVVRRAPPPAQSIRVAVGETFS